MKNVTEIVCILDRSGSMESIKDDTIGGFNNFLKEQQKLDDPARISMYLFDHEYKALYESVDIREAPILDNSNYIPRGRTALYDAVGRTLATIDEKFKQININDMPEKVIILIVTDGAENASKEYNGNTINDMIGHHKKVNNWEFVFLSADETSFNDSAFSNVGINNTIMYRCSGAGMQTATRGFSSSVSSYRKEGKFIVNKDEYGDISKDKR